ncbi:AMP-dependent synthetase/ligase domain-containing protein [Plasmodiophora brassicae]
MGASQSTDAFDYEKQLESDTTPQSTAVGHARPDTDPKEYTEMRRFLKYEKANMKYVNEGTPDEIRSLWQALAKTAARVPSNPAFGTRVFDDISNGDFKWQTYQEALDQSVAVGRGLVSRGLVAGNNVGLFAANRAEWMITAFGVWSQRMRVVPIYSTLGPNAVEYIVNHAELTIIFVSKDNINEVLSIVDKTQIKLLVQFDVNESAYGNARDSIDEAHRAKAEKAGVNLIGLSDLIAEGQRRTDVDVVEPSDDDLAYLMYTSGTTGQPKGAMVSHGNVVAAVAGVENSVNVLPTDSYLSFLPLAHIFETCVEVAIIVRGGKIGFWQGNIKKLTEDLGALRPTVMAAVPRVFQRIYQTVFSTVNSAACLKRTLFLRAYARQTEAVRSGAGRSSIYDSLVFSPVAAKVGLGNIRAIVSGGAPLPPYLFEFMKVIFNCIVVQGYGLTETSAGLTITLGTDRNAGHVGPPVACVDVRLRSIPEMGYKVTDARPRGEIMVRGPNVFQGYFKNEQATKESFDEDGFYCTGDVGRWNPNGTLSVIDRKKNIFKLSQGEYVASEHIEAVYGKSPLVGQLWIYGNSFKSFVVAVVVPNGERFIEIGTERGWYKGPAFGREGFPEAFADMWASHHDDLKKVLVGSLNDHASALKGFEKARDVHVEYNVNRTGFGFTEENECMTPTFKLRPPFLLKRYRNELRELYAKNGEPPAADEKWPGE